MVELIVVLVLVGILGAIGAARFFDRKVFDTSVFADQALAAIRYAQKAAIARNGTVNVVFNGPAISLCYPTGTTCTPLQAPFAATTDDTYCKSSNAYCVRAPQGVSYTTSIPESTGTFGFDALGRPVVDASGTPLESLATVDISGGATSRQITVEPETGYVH